MGKWYYFKRSIQKYGKENFSREYLIGCDSKLELDFLEKKYIFRLKPEYNIAEGGQGGFLGNFVEEKRLASLRTEECRQKISKKSAGHSVSLETRQKISKANTGHKVSEESKQLISIKNKGRKRTEESKKALSLRLKGLMSPFKGKKHTEESNKKCSESMKKYCLTHPERNKSISEALKGKKHAYLPRPYLYVKVICIESLIVYDSIATAAKSTNINLSSISHCCSGKYKTAGGYHWEYYKEEKEEGKLNGKYNYSSI